MTFFLERDQAYEFAKYLTDAEASRVMALEGRQSPANKAVYSDPKVGEDPVHALAAERPAAAVEHQLRDAERRAKEGAGRAAGR